VLESVLYFLLGFLAAGLLALMVSPMVWQRAVALTKRRIERSVPLTLNEIQADKDQLRAEFAMSTRRLEMSVEDLREKAANQIIEINRKRDDINRLAEEHVEKIGVVEELQAKSVELQAQLRQREEQLEEFNTRLAEIHEKMDQKALQYEKLQQRFEKAQTDSNSNRIELVAKQSELENLSDKYDDLNKSQSAKRAKAAANELQRQLDRTKSELGKEKNNVEKLEQKLEQNNHELTTNQDRLERREQELSRLRHTLESDGATNSELTSKLVDQQSLAVELEAKLAQANLQMEALLHDASNDNVEKAMASLEDEKFDLTGKLEQVTSERDNLVKELTALTGSQGAEWESERRENSILRERINDLAAQVTAMTASLEGDGSPITEILARKENTTIAQIPQGEKASPSDQPFTLADRIRALQDASG